MGGYLRWEAIAYGVTLMQNPAVVIPCGLGPEGLPFGIQIVGPNRSDAWLLDAAAALFQALQKDARTRQPFPTLRRCSTRPPAFHPPRQSRLITRETIMQIRTSFRTGLAAMAVLAAGLMAAVPLLPTSLRM